MKNNPVFVYIRSFLSGKIPVIPFFDPISDSLVKKRTLNFAVNH